MYTEAVELCAFLFKEFGLDPMEGGVVIGHYEAHQLGIASNHGDPRNWFSRFGKSMETFRADVKKLLFPASKPAPAGKKKIYRIQLGAFTVKANADNMLKKVRDAGFIDAFIRYGE